MLGHDIKAMLPDGRRALRINDFCKIYGVSRSTVYKLATEGRLPLRKIAGRSLIRIEDAEALLNGLVPSGCSNSAPAA
jgi:excisionase family DNA binding protein